MQNSIVSIFANLFYRKYGKKIIRGGIQQMKNIKSNLEQPRPDSATKTLKGAVTGGKIAVKFTSFARE